MEVKRTERGWAGHFICGDRCRFRRNTLIEYGDKKWVVSSVGAMYLFNPLTRKSELDSVGYERWYETMAFVARDDEYNDADVSQEIHFESEWGLFGADKDDFLKNHPMADMEANEMHEKVVEELMKKIKEGD